MTGWTPEAIADAALKIGTPLVIFGATVYLVSKLLDFLKVWVSKRGQK